MDDQIPMFAGLPVTDPAKKKKQVNCLQEMLIELLDSRKVQLADIQRSTGIPWGTLHGWYVGNASTQLADENLLKLARYFQVSLEYLCFGIGEDESPTKDFESDQSLA